MKPANAMLSALPTTIFSVMSALALEHDAVNLGQGFPDTEGPADLIDVAAAALRDGRNQYPPLAGLPELRAAVASANLRFCGIEVDPATEVVVTCGATEAITASLMALVNPGDEVVVFEPLYDTYLPVLRMLGAVARPVRLLPPDWSLPREALEAAVGPRTKAILLNTPMNPTGKVFTRAELEFIAGLMARHDVYAVCDEVYEHLTFAPVRHVALMSLPGMKARHHPHRQRGQELFHDGMEGRIRHRARAACGPGGEGAPVADLHRCAEPAARGGRRAGKGRGVFPPAIRKHAPVARYPDAGPAGGRIRCPALRWQLFRHRRFRPAGLWRR